MTFSIIYCKLDKAPVECGPPCPKQLITPILPSVLISQFCSCLTICIKDKDLFIGPQEFVVGYSKAPEQPQSSAMPICHSHTMMSTGCEPATICIAAYRSSLRYALRHRSINEFRAFMV